MKPLESKSSTESSDAISESEYRAERDVADIVGGDNALPPNPLVPVLFSLERLQNVFN